MQHGWACQGRKHSLCSMQVTQGQKSNGEDGSMCSFKALCPPNSVPLDRHPRAMVIGRGQVGRTICLPAASVSVVLARAQLLVAESVFTDDNLLQQFLFLRLHVKRKNSLAHARAAPSSLQLVLNPRNNYFRANNHPSCFTALIFRSLQFFGILSRHFLPSLTFLAFTPREREMQSSSHTHIVRGTLSCSLLCSLATCTLMTLCSEDFFTLQRRTKRRKCHNQGQEQGKCYGT